MLLLSSRPSVGSLSMSSRPSEARGEIFLPSFPVILFVIPGYSFRHSRLDRESIVKNSLFYLFVGEMPDQVGHDGNLVGYNGK